MRILSGEEERIAMQYIDIAAQLALKSPCYRSRCGSVVVKDSKIIGRGFNSPPGNKTLDHCLKDDLPADFKSDKTCCIHAEQRAISDALRNHPDMVEGARIYFIRVDKEGRKTRAGKPFCTMCSKQALDEGLAEFVLWHAEGVCVYGTEEYNEISFGR